MYRSKNYLKTVTSFQTGCIFLQLFVREFFQNESFGKNFQWL